MRKLALLLALIIIPIANAYVLVYTNGFDYQQNYGKDTYVNVESVDQILATWRNWGYEDIRASNRLDPNADGIIILGCTKLDEEDIRTLDEYVKNGGRLVIDLYCPGKLDDFMYQYGIIRSDKAYEGTILQNLTLPYATIRGYPIDKPILMRDTPINSKYVRMIYTGPTFTATSETFSDVFITPTGQSVAFIANIEKGKVYATGCLLCSNQLLMANILDWVADGKVDFPKFEVDRRIYPPIKEVGKPFYDELRISVSPEEKESMEISVAYPYNEEGFCKLVPVQERETQDNTIIFRFEYTPEDKMSCNLAPVIVSMTWISPKGKITREFTVPGEYVQVIAPSFHVSPSMMPYIIGAAIIIIISLGVIGWTYYRRRKLEDMKTQLKALEESMEDLQKKLMTRQITEDVYKRLMERYIAEIEELKAKIRLLEEKQKKNKKK